jgi:hypothetical protein
LFFVFIFIPAGFAEADALYEQIHEGVTFHLGFDKTIAFASRAAGKPEARVSGKLDFAPGVKGLGLLSKEKGVSLRYTVKENLSFERPGSIAFWIKPMNWRKPVDQPNDKAGHKKRIYQPFFMTKYKKSGYLGLERMSSHLVGKKDNILLFISGFKGIQAGMSCSFNLDNGRWRYIVLTWDPLTFRLYIDGKEIAHTTLQRKISNSELSRNFIVHSPGRSVIDEFFIYKYALDSARIAKFHKYYRAFTLKKNNK